MPEAAWKTHDGPLDAFQEAVELPQFVFGQHFRG
jgi:hypothetical protein